MRAPEFDCRSCGACCQGAIDPRSAELARRVGSPIAGGWVNCTATDVAALPKRHRLKLVPVSDGTNRMLATPQLANGRCGFLRGELGADVSCAVYDHRPTVCRKYEAGSESCRASRREIGLAA